MAVDRESAKLEVTSQEALFDKFYDRLPKEFLHHSDLLKSRLWRSPEVWSWREHYFSKLCGRIDSIQEEVEIQLVGVHRR